jgi:uncharacterized delta-60 repeat protein
MMLVRFGFRARQKRSLRRRNPSGGDVALRDWIAEPLEPRVLLSGSLKGIVWNDANGDGRIAARGESNLAGWTVYLDQNRNRQLDANEAHTTTDGAGRYTFSKLPGGTYVVAQQPPAKQKGSVAAARARVLPAQVVTAGTGKNERLFQLTYTGSAIAAHVDGFESDAPVMPSDAQSGPLITLTNFQSDPRFIGVNGAGFSVAVLDTGIDLDHPYFGPDADSNGVADRIVYQYDFADGDADASDVNGHGSNVASIAAGSDTTNGGMAPGANIIALKVFGDSGTGSFGTIESALQWVAANADLYNIASVNMSLGDTQNWTSAVQLYGISDEMQALATKNVIVCAADGNSFYEFGSTQGVAYPAADPNSLAIGATFDGNNGGIAWSSGARDFSSGADRIVSFSQRSSTLTDIFAPGSVITGAGPTGGTSSYSGTSQATPHIAGIAVLAQQLAMRDLGRRLTLSEFSGLLQSTGVTVYDGDDEDDNVVNTNQAYKRVDVLALASAIENMSPTARVNGQVFNDADGDSTLDAGESGQSGWTVYLDANNNDVLDAGETSAATNASGNYTLGPVVPGNYVLREVRQSGWVQTAPMPAGAYTLTLAANQTAANSNFGNRTLAPQESAQPAVPDLVAASDSGKSSGDDLTNLDNSAAGQSLQFTIGKSVAGATLTLYADGVAVGSAVASGTTTTITTNGALDLADGAHAFTAKQTESGKVASAASGTRNLTIDTVAPGAPDPAPDLAAASDSGVSTTDNITNDDTPTITVAAGPYFRLFRGATQLNADYTTLAVVTDTLSSDNTYSYTVKAVDDAGNVSAASSALGLTLDRVAPGTPAAPVLQTASDSGLSNSDGITNDNTPTFNVAGSPYFRFYSGNSLLSSSYQSGSTYTPAAQADNSYSYNQTAVDAAGNESGHSGNTSVLIDTQAWATPTAGSLDLTFNASGKATLAASAGDDNLAAVALQSDGKIVAAGDVNDVFAGNVQIGVVRYNTDGTPDSTFGNGGLVITGFQFRDLANAVAIQPDGKILVGGYSAAGNSSSYSTRFLVARFNANGTLDTTFGGGTGRVITNVGTGQCTVYGLAVQSDGKIVASGDAFDGTSSGFAVARYNANGTLDTTFDGDGITIVQITGGSDVQARVALDGNGKIVLVGMADTERGWTNFDVGVARLNPNGTLDTTFDGDGKNKLFISTLTNAGVNTHSLALTSDGGVLIGGTVYFDGGTDNAFLMRLTPGGALDTAFANQGSLVTTYNTPSWRHAGLDAIVLQPDGQILGAGYNYTNLHPARPALMRLSPAGVPDATFGSGGYVIETIPTTGRFDGGVLQPDGTFVGAGNLWSGQSTSTAEFFVARFHAYDAASTPTIDLQSASDTGVSNTDNVTKNSTPTFDISHVSGHYDRVYRGGTRVGQDYIPGTTFTAPAQGDGTSTYALRIVDAAGNESATTSSIAVTVDTVNPSVSIFGAPASSPEGSAISMAANVTDASSGFTYAWGVTKNGSAYASGTDANFSTTPDDNGTYVVSLGVTDKAGNTGNAAAKTVTANNVAPTATAFSASPTDTIDPGATASVSFTGPADVSSADTTAGFTYSYDFDNDSTFDVTGATSSSAVVPASYLTTTGAHTVRARITDKDGGATDYTTDVTVRLPQWLSADSAAVWNSATKHLAVSGAATITADPGADAPIVDADGPSANLTIQPQTLGIAIVNLAALNLSNGATAALSAGGIKTLVVNSLFVTTGGRLDLADHAMIVRSGDAFAVPSLIAAGRHGGDWRGASGITSSSAAADPTHLTTLAYATAAELNRTSFAGVNDLAPTDLVVKYTYLGDADLSGATTLDDFTLYLTGYQNGKTDWFNGDFDYNGIVTLDDFTVYLVGYQRQGAAL